MESSGKTLKRFCPTRWSSREEAVVALRYRYTDILKVLNQIILTSDKKDEVNEAMGLQKAMEKFTFIFLVVIGRDRVSILSFLLNHINSRFEFLEFTSVCGYIVFDGIDIVPDSLLSVFDFVFDTFFD